MPYHSSVTWHPSDGAKLAPVRPDLVWFGGADAVKFLNDLISQRIDDMSAGEARRSMLLGPKGSVDHLLWVISDGDRIGLLTDSGRGEDLASSLGRYRIRVDVSIDPEDDGAWVVVGPYDGPDISWAGVERHLVVGSRPDLDEMDPAEYERLRIASGEPLWGVDVDEGTLPHETELVDVSVDFDKGCYLGQELVARVDSRGGNSPRRLRLLVSDDDEIVADSPVVTSDGEVGVVTSAVGSLGMGRLKRSVEIGDRVSVGAVAATVTPVPRKTRV